jgi:hypothetical protein
VTGTLQQAPAWIVDEVNALSRAGKLREGVSFDDACALAEMILVDGCRWGDYYGARRSAAPRLAKRRKRVAHEIDALTDRWILTRSATPDLIEPARYSFLPSRLLALKVWWKLGI